MTGTRLAGVCFLAMAIGCGSGSGKVAPAGGTVYLDDAPLPNAGVIFQPMGSRENPNPGRGSFATTDAQGKFTLKVDGQDPGAVVGTHRVAVTTVQTEETKVDKDTGSEDGIVPKGREKIPAKYNEKTELKVEIPAKGNTGIEIKLYSEKATSKKK